MQVAQDPGINPRTDVTKVLNKVTIRKQKQQLTNSVHRSLPSNVFVHKGK